jgi:hypothetical protein
MTPDVQAPPSQYATTTCVSDNGTFCTSWVTQTPNLVYTQDRGNVSFGLAIIIALLAMTLTAFLFNMFSPKR